MDVQLQYPENWWWLLALPAVLVMVIFYLGWKRRRIAQLADAHLLPSIIPFYSPLRQWMKYGCLALAIGLLSLVMLNPQKPDEKARTQISGLDMLLVMDVSQSMLAADISPDRLENARLLAESLIDTLQGSRIGLLAFAGDARLLSPLTDDAAAVKDLLSSLNTESVTLDGTDISAALTTAADAIGKSDPTHKAVVMITDGEELDGSATDAIRLLKDLGVHMAIVGMGTTSGALVKDREGAEMQNPEGGRVVSRLNEKMLQQLATMSNGKYVGPGNTGEQLKSLLQYLREVPSRPLSNSLLVNFYSYGHLLIALAVALLLMSILMSERRSQRKPSLASMMLGIALGISVQPAQAQKAAYNWHEADQLYQKGQLAEAEAAYKKGLQQQPGDWRAQMQLGNIAYRKGDHDAALKHYRAAKEKVSTSEQASWLDNNIGLTLARQQESAKAVDAFKEALRKNPYDEEAQQNLAQALADWQEQQNRKPPPAPDKKKPEDKLKALQQEEKRIRQSLQKKHPRNNNGKNW